jgi:hypothetical protein
MYAYRGGISSRWFALRGFLHIFLPEQVCIRDESKAILNEFFVGEGIECAIVRGDEALKTAWDSALGWGRLNGDNLCHWFFAAHHYDFLAGFGFFQQPGEVSLGLMNGVGHGLSVLSPLVEVNLENAAGKGQK